MPLTGIGTGVLVGVGEGVAVSVGVAVSNGLVGVVRTAVLVGAAVGWGGNVAAAMAVDSAVDGRVRVASSGVS